jgi:hypothetical protein
MTTAELLELVREAVEACPEPAYIRGNHPNAGDAYDEDFAYWHRGYLKPLAEALRRE